MELTVTLSVLLTPFAISSYIAWAHPNRKGLTLGALTLWAYLFLGEVFLITHYGTGGPAGIMLALWVVIGFPISLLFCELVRGVRAIVLKSRKSIPEAPAAP